MTKFFANLTSREQLVLTVGLILLPLLAFVYWWDFLDSEITALRTEVKTRQELVDWLAASSRDVKILQGTTGNGTGVQEGELMALIETSSKQFNLQNLMKRVEPASNSGVRVWFDDVKFDDIMAWLTLLQLKHNVVVKDFKADSRDLPGIVALRLTLSGSP